MMERMRNPVIWLLAVAGLFPFWAAAHVDLQQLGDDALITLTYAKNLARGDGFVFNHPPAVLGTTTPLFALTVALLSRILGFAELTAVAVFFSAACWSGLVWCWFAFRRQLQLSDWQAGILGFVVAASGWVRHLDMEAYLFAFLLVASTGLYFRRNMVWAGLAAGLLFLTRGEGVLVFGLLLAISAYRDWRAHWSDGGKRSRSSAVLLCAGFAIPVLSWSLYAQLTFGGVLPNTLAAKIAQGASGLWRPFLSQLVSVWMPSWGRQLAIPGIPLVNLWQLLALLGLVVVIARKRAFLVMVIWVAAYVVGYSALGVAGYPWYSLPVHFVLTVLVGVGLGSVAEFVVRRTARPVVGSLIAGLVVAIVVFRLGAPSVSTTLNPKPSARHTAYHELAGWLRANTDPADSVAYHEIGYLGYYTDNRIVDLVGLVTPQITPHVAIGDFGWGFWQATPDYLVQLEGSRFFAGIVGDPRFPRMYEYVDQLPGFGGRRLAVYRRFGDG